MNELVLHIESTGPEVAARVLADMYQNPFWDERFGARGRKFSAEDGQLHVSYLVEALVAQDPEVLSRYSSWLQSVLVSRGMCSRHLAENFERLAGALAERGYPGIEHAREYLQRAVDVLRYAPGPARELQDASAALIPCIAAALCARHPQWESHWGQVWQERCIDDLVYLLSYIADAVEQKRPELFIAHARWLSGFWERRGIPREHLIDTLEIIADEVERAGVSAELCTVVTLLMDRAKDVLCAMDPGAGKEQEMSP